MTDEEKAKEWVRTNSGYSTKEFHGQKAIEAFLAGLEYNNKQLTKAKEIIKNLVDSLEVIDGEQIRELKVVKEAEQYLKEECNV